MRRPLPQTPVSPSDLPMPFLTKPYRLPRGRVRFSTKLAPALVVWAAGLVTLACAPPRANLPTTTTDTPTLSVLTPGVEAAAKSITPEAWALVSKADRASEQKAADYLLSAAEQFTDARQYSLASAQIERVASLSLTELQRDDLRLQTVKLQQARGEHVAAVELLQAMRRQADMSTHTRQQVLALLAESQILLNQTDQAILSLIERDDYVRQSERPQNQAKIIQTITRLEPLSLSLLQETVENPIIEGWLRLADVMRASSKFTATAEQFERYPDLQRWRTVYPHHPAQPAAILAILVGRQTQQAQHLALLLPLTSPFSKAAQAFQDGFLAAQAQAPAINRPAVKLYDIGQDTRLTASYYQTAVDNGAQFIVGPLGRRAVDALLGSAIHTLPTLLLGSIAAPQRAANLFSISLSPEQEAQQVAERAYADGHQQAGIFRNNTERGQRLAAAFAAHWQRLGGRVVLNKTLAPGSSGEHYADSVQELLDIDHSQARKHQLGAELGMQFRFAARRRDDMDYLFLATSAKQARLIVPQLRFFQAHDLPLYATSDIYTGKPNPALDADLDGVIFGDIDWMLRVDPRTQKTKPPAPAAPAAVEEDAAAAALSQTDPALPAAETTGDTLPQDSTQDATQAALQAAPETIDQTAAQTTAQTPTQATDDSAEWQVLAESIRAAFERSPYHHSELDRLYALGFESYNLIPQLDSLRHNPLQQHVGKTMRVSVDADGNARRQLVWATFKNGLPVPLETTNTAKLVN